MSSDSAARPAAPVPLLPPAGVTPPRYALRAAVAAAAVWACTGCGNGLHDVKGVVLVEGQPAAEGVQVLFLPLGHTRVANGTVAADGAFSMQTDQKRGVMPGDYVVTLVNSTASIPRPDTPVDESSGRPPQDVAGWMAAVAKLLENPPVGPGWIPKSYADMAQSPLRVSVPKDGPSVKFEVPANRPEPKKAGGPR